MATEIKAPGLQWRDRNGGKRVPVWVARQELVKKGYLPKTVQLHYDPATQAEEIIARCNILQAEMLEWAGGGKRETVYDGKVSTLLRLYENDRDGPYHKDLRQRTQKSYSKHLRLLVNRVGDTYIPELTGADTKRWYHNMIDGGNSVGYAALTINIFKAVLSYGASAGLEGCKQLRDMMSSAKFHAGNKRKELMSYEQICAFRAKAHEMGRPSAALWVTFQYDFCIRRRDVIGEWLDKKDPTTGNMIKEWEDGFTWAHIDDNGVLKKELSKTRFTSGVTVEHQLANYPDLLAELAHIPLDQRDPLMPIVINESTGLPYTDAQCRYYFRTIATAAGIPKTVWNMDARAGAASEANEAGAETKDTMVAGGWTQLPTMNRYNRRLVEQTGRVAKLRTAHRAKKPNGGSGNALVILPTRSNFPN